MLKIGRHHSGEVTTKSALFESRGMVNG